jgi:hypothetical protein
MKVFRSLAFAAAVLTLALAGNAATVELTYNGLSSSRQVTIKKNPFDDGYTGDVKAGGFKMTGASTDPTAPSHILGSFIAFCLDIGAHMFGSGSKNFKTYETTDNPFGSFSINKTAVERFYDANFASVNVNTANQSAAFQIGLWATIYGSDFEYSSTNTTLIGLVNDYVTAGATYGGDRIWTLTYLESTDDPRYQNLVTATPIPLPATGLLMLGLMGLGGIASIVARRRRTDS